MPKNLYVFLGDISLHNSKALMILREFVVINQ